MKVIDVDSHSRPRTQDYKVEPEYEYLRPRSYMDGKGNMLEFFNGRVIRKLPSDTLAMSDKTVPDWRAADYDAEVRYKHVIEAGIDFQFVSAGIVGEFNYIDAQVGAAFLRSNNNWLYNNFMKRYPKTFMGLPQFPLQDIREAIKELERCVNDLGMLTFLMPSNWNGIDLADQHWWGFWDKARELGITGIIVHRGGLIGAFMGQERLKVLGPDGTLSRAVMAAPLDYTANIINLIFGGMMEAFPEFKFAFLEVETEFPIATKLKLKQAAEQFSYLREKISQPFQRYFDRFYFVVEDVSLEENGKRLQYAIQELGEDQILFGSDYPHTESHIGICAKLRALTSISEAQKEKVLGKNAAKLIGGRLF